MPPMLTPGSINFIDDCSGFTLWDASQFRIEDVDRTRGVPVPGTLVLSWKSKRSWEKGFKKKNSRSEQDDPDPYSEYGSGSMFQLT